MATTKVSTKLLKTVGVAEGGTGATSAGAAFTSIKQGASTTATGVVELATAAEVNTGTSTALVVTADALEQQITGATTAVVTAADEFLFADVGSSNARKKDTVQGILDLVSGGASNAEKANIMLNAFRISVNGSLTRQNMVDGVVDEFEDETGIDTSTSTNETYDSTSDYYSNPGATTTQSSSGEWLGKTSEYSFSGSDIICTGNDNKIWLSDDFAGNFSFYFLTDIVDGHGSMSTNFHLMLTSDKGSANADSYIDTFATWGWNRHPSANYLRYGTNLGTDVFTMPTVATGDRCIVSRTGSNISVTFKGSLVHTFSQTSSASVTMAVGQAAGAFGDLKDIYWEIPGTAPDMTLFSNATTALAAPDDANIVIWQQDVDSITLNTDLKAYASRNGGTTYTQMTLSEVASLTTGRILTGTVDISGQSSATAMKYKIETLNTKEQKIHAVALQWS